MPGESLDLDGRRFEVIATPGHASHHLAYVDAETRLLFCGDAAGLRKLGVLMGDKADVGCNAVLNPGTILGRHALVYPCTHWRGVLAANCIAKNRAAVEVVERGSLWFLTLLVLLIVAKFSSPTPSG
mgnify:CR=1 FL=1